MRTEALSMAGCSEVEKLLWAQSPVTTVQNNNDSRGGEAKGLLLAFDSLSSRLQQWRGIRVKVRNNNLDQALALMQRKMQSSGIERMIRNEQTCHIKNSEKRVLAKKNLERKIRAQDLARKLKMILVQKVR
ncbi:hypothetical protein DH2020_027073 [Rehmannia glutinosa]|uniref:Ribosomal protein S21 n=1 Tax=Rehmannia glutinosa TaxID=99300 RepID=A0ABR0VY34_REHGL